MSRDDRTNVESLETLQVLDPGPPLRRSSEAGVWRHGLVERVAGEDRPGSRMIYDELVALVSGCIEEMKLVAVQLKHVIAFDHLIRERI